MSMAFGYNVNGSFENRVAFSDFLSLLPYIRITNGFISTAVAASIIVRLAECFRSRRVCEVYIPNSRKCRILAFNDEFYRSQF